MAGGGCGCFDCDPWVAELWAPAWIVSIMLIVYVKKLLRRKQSFEEFIYKTDADPAKTKRKLVQKEFMTWFVWSKAIRRLKHTTVDSNQTVSDRHNRRLKAHIQHQHERLKSSSKQIS